MVKTNPINLSNFKVPSKVPKTQKETPKVSRHTKTTKEKYFIAVEGTKTLQIYNGTFLPYDKAVVILKMLQDGGINAHLYPFTDIERHIEEYEAALTRLEHIQDEISDTST